MLNKQFVEEYVKIKAAFSELKSKENKMRLEICKYIFENCVSDENNPNKFKGELFGLDFKAERKSNIKFKEEDYFEIEDDLTEEEAACFEEKTIIKLKDKKYKELNEQIQNGTIDPKDLHIFDIITEKPALPTLKIGADDSDDD